MTDSRHRELGDFLRSRRKKLSPEAVGLPTGRRRRTPGLRREELAELANIGVDWYVRLEQGRDVRPSMATIGALAKALRLDPVEGAHFRALAQSRGQRPFVGEVVPASMQRLLESLTQPAYITGRRWDLLAWNAAAVDALLDFDLLAHEDRNILLFMLTDPQAKRLFGAGWADEARRMVGQFRATHDLWAGERTFLELLERLRRGSPEFVNWWEAHDIRPVAAGQKVLFHPEKGPQRYDYSSFQANDDPALKLVLYTPV